MFHLCCSFEAHFCFVECFSQLIPNMPGQSYSSVINRRKQSFGCLSDLEPTAIDEDKQG